MDDVESVELDEAGVEDYGPPATVTANIAFKSGENRVVTFKTPAWTPVYAEPLTDVSIHQIISSAFSVGDVPFLALPTDSEGAMVYFDLSAVNSVDVKVVLDEPSE